MVSGQALDTTGMGESMKLVGFVFLGFIAIAVIYTLVLIATLKAFPDMGGCGDLWLPFLILMPASLLLGSMVTGFLSCPTLTTKWGLPFMAPGLYFLLALLPSGLFAGNFDSASNTFLALLFFLYWYLASLAGVVLGYFLRALIRHTRGCDWFE